MKTPPGARAACVDEAVVEAGIVGSLAVDEDCGEDNDEPALDTGVIVTGVAATPTQ